MLSFILLLGLFPFGVFATSDEIEADGNHGGYR